MLFVAVVVVVLLVFILVRIAKMTEASDNLAREVAETREAVTALTGRYQAKIDQMQVHIDELTAALANGDTEAATAAATALDALQTEMAALGTDAGAGTGDGTGAATGTGTGDGA